MQPLDHLELGNEEVTQSDLSALDRHEPGPEFGNFTRPQVETTGCLVLLLLLPLLLLLLL